MILVACTSADRSRPRPTVEEDAAIDRDQSPERDGALPVHVGDDDVVPTDYVEDPTCADVVPPNSAEAAALIGDDAGTEADADAGMSGEPLTGGAVCGCDGRRYPSAAAAEALGVEVDPWAYCTVGGDRFGCGPERCMLGEEACGSVISHANCCQPGGHVCIPVDRKCLANANSDPERCACAGNPNEDCRIVETAGGLAIYKIQFWGH